MVAQKVQTTVSYVCEIMCLFTKTLFQHSISFRKGSPNPFDERYLVIYMQIPLSSLQMFKVFTRRNLPHLILHSLSNHRQKVAFIPLNFLFIISGKCVTKNYIQILWKADISSNIHNSGALTGRIKNCLLSTSML